MSEVVIAAESRTGFGKGAARKIRREHKVPVVLYGHGTDPRHLSLPGHELLLALRTPNVLIRLEGAVDELAIPKGVQRDPIKGFLEHVDLLLVKRGEKVTVDIPVNVVGEVSDGILDQQMVSVSVETEATHIPEGVEVDVAGLEVGAQVTAGDLKLPKGTTLVADPEALVLIVSGAQAAEPVEGEAAEGESAEAAEGEAAEAAEGESAE
ncbi:50S ribosomal protein L25/general stress protein Ctc [Planomonospora sp. ID91781]|uniref:Large ribosomal subunit protein bL25 n=1 Tax=Planomonospora sphaerica TaxID=161355 RepID=A0A171DL44_9ACTN|nr:MULTISPECIES: 50S ribosomal protein L25/general stress protein Ctc [Planomonospora]MBG0819264.1 50S ribosomal protein L25/general stress protein Ctc [Planomonospora sp. ID91781]GAT69552.1 50S ribosomal protein L25 [Planomonospora sphaerica]